MYELLFNYLIIYYLTVCSCLPPNITHRIAEPRSPKRRTILLYPSPSPSHHFYSLKENPTTSDCFSEELNADIRVWSSRATFWPALRFCKDQGE